MLERVAPPGTVLPDVYTEYHEDGTTFGRQLGTYPLLVGLPGEHPLGELVDVAVVDWGYRSVTAVPYPVDPNAASMTTLEALPGVSRSGAGDLVVNRPYDSPRQAAAVVGDSVGAGGSEASGVGAGGSEASGVGAGGSGASSGGNSTLAQFFAVDPEAGTVPHSSLAAEQGDVVTDEWIESGAVGGGSDHPTEESDPADAD
jgi:hypothetical protein